MTYFTTEQKKLIERISMFKDLISEQDIHDKPCPLLVSQLNELEVMTDKLLSDVHSLQECLK